ncbi:MAG: hypothetical protein IT280_04050, partial [Ignavibacteria bacterium]|nr:hypothetical protein [Ignavibacteria bacterium]
YDYFGARYYDSRIGRWGQVEPLLDKYVNLTPYCYSINNPVIVKDPNGKDPRVTVDGNSITLTTDVYYTTDENYKYAFNSDTEYLLENLKDGADLWNEAGESITIDNENYNVRFEVNLHKVSIYEMTSIAPGVIPPPGVNIAKYNEDAIKEMVLNGNIIELVDPKVLTSKGYELPQYWDTHELGHILGFKDMFKDSKLQEGSFNIMGGNLKHGKPTKEDVEKLIKGLGIDLKNKAHSEVKKGGTVQP